MDRETVAKDKNNLLAFIEQGFDKISRQESEKTTMFPMRIYRQNSPENPLKSAPMSLSKQFHSSQLRLRKGKPFPDDALSYQNSCFRSK